MKFFPKMHEFCGNRRDIFKRKDQTWENFPWTLKDFRNREKSGTEGNASLALARWTLLLPCPTNEKNRTKGAAARKLVTRR